MENAVGFWNSLNHNWKKIILLNYDFHKRFNGDFKKIASHILLKGPYNAYYLAFNLRIRTRLDEFTANEETLEQLFKTDLFILNYPGITDLSPLRHFSRLQDLYLNLDIDFFNQIPVIESVKNLSLACSSLQNLTGIANWVNLKKVKFVYCYKLEKIEGLKLCKKLRTIDLQYLGRISDISALIEIPEIRIHKDMVHYNDSYSSEIYQSFLNNHTTIKGLLYNIGTEESVILTYCSNPIVRKNYYFLLESSRFQIHLDGYSEWILIRNNDQNALDPIKKKTLLNYFRSIFKP